MKACVMHMPVILFVFSLCFEASDFAAEVLCLRAITEDLYSVRWRLTVGGNYLLQVTSFFDDVIRKWSAHKNIEESGGSKSLPLLEHPFICSTVSRLAKCL